MSCDFKPGDEVVCVDASGAVNGIGHCWAGDVPIVGQVYTVTALEVHLGLVCALLAEIKNRRLDGFDGYDAARFRKVERRTDKQSLTEWLSQPSGDTDHLDKPLPAKKRERA